MFYISDIYTTAPTTFDTPLQKQVYHTLQTLQIPFQRVHTQQVITMNDCIQINQKLDMDMVKTLFLCNRQKTQFYLFATTASKPFQSKAFCSALDISRVSFAPTEYMEKILGTKIGATTIFSTLFDTQHQLQIVLDQQVAKQKWYGCSDGTTTGYLKIETEQILKKFLPFVKHQPYRIEV